MLYCLHSNKKPTLFYKNKLSVLAKQAKLINQQQNICEKEKKNQLIQLGGQLRDAIFMEQQPDQAQAKIFDELAAEWIVQFTHTDIERIYKQTCKINKSFFPLKNEIKKFIKLKECDDKKISDFISKLVKLDTPQADVNRFIVNCIRHMFPEKLLGKENKNYLLTQVSECIRMKKFEMLSFKEVYKRVKKRVT